MTKNVIGYTSHPYRVPLTYLVDGGSKCWEVSEPITYVLTNGETIVIPKGFKTDLASVPKIFNSIINTFGDFIHGALVHDWIYVTDYKRDELGDYKGRLFADKEFLFWSKRFDSDQTKIYSMYYGIRLFGGKVFKRRFNNLER